MIWTLPAAILAAALLALAGTLLVRASVRIRFWVPLGAGLLAVLVTAALAAALGGISPLFGATIASGAAPIAVPLAAALSRGPRTGVREHIAVAVWAAVIVPLAIVVPARIVATCPPTSCVVEDFGGALPFVVAVGGFLLVPSVGTIGLNRLRNGSGSRLIDLVAGLAVVPLFAVWLAAAEGDVDDYTNGLVISGLAAPALGALGWLTVDRLRGVRATTGRALRMGAMAGMAVILPGAAAMTPPWLIGLGFVGGCVGALAHDARAIVSAPEALRAAVTALTLGAVGMVAPGILGTAIGFVFAARTDVTGSQFVATLAVAAGATALSLPVAVLGRRRGR
ncbi:ammonium transporter [Schumannella soli]|uniref:Ammonium transporter n=1 Tax=Schumannella soli TaxID=2590779 RepID=A0A506Y0Y3_9MICO|nr:ammonium transporter [Schumannella soli]TPW76196.1 ammonium transporter [Schumannella soli]